jgi:hypothetical protein
MKPPAWFLLLAALSLRCGYEPLPAASGPVPPPTDDSKPVLLAAPSLHVAAGIESGVRILHWTASPRAAYYTVEADADSTFSARLAIYQGPALTLDLGANPPSHFGEYVRVRAENSIERSGWSAARRVL